MAYCITESGHIVCMLLGTDDCILQDACLPFATYIWAVPCPAR
jgi:hypothetical protein